MFISFYQGELTFCALKYYNWQQHRLQWFEYDVNSWYDFYGNRTDYMDMTTFTIQYKKSQKSAPCIGEHLLWRVNFCSNIYHKHISFISARTQPRGSTLHWNIFHS